MLAIEANAAVMKAGDGTAAVFANGAKVIGPMLWALSISCAEIALLR